jgi:thiamine biosynthesis lipoprotein
MSERGRATRRDFLKGKAAIDALGELAAPEEAIEGPGSAGSAPAAAAGRAAEGDAEHYLVTVSRQAMACEFSVYLGADQRSDGTDAAIEALDLVERLEDQLTIYRDQSELIDLNRQAGHAAVKVEAGMFALLQLGLRIHAATDGAFDMTSGPLSQAWGFSRREGRVPSGDKINEALSRQGSEQVVLDERAQTVRFMRADIELNVNGIGKGYALDQASGLLRAAGVESFLFHGGQSSVTAAGDAAGGDGRGWTVGLTHPMRPQRRVAEFFLRDRALGTSGSGTQFFHSAGQRFGHVLDPRSGWPAEGVYSATVLAPTAAEADALATAFYVLGPEKARSVCDEWPGVAMAMVVPGSRKGAIEIHTHGLTDDDWRRLDE